MLKKMLKQQQQQLAASIQGLHIALEHIKMLKQQQQQQQLAAFIQGLHIALEHIR